MARVLYFMAMIANVLAVLVLTFVLFTEVNRGEEIIILALCALPPILSIIALYTLPDFAARKLEREVHKARLRKELKDLEG
jgi:hypothetical protein